MVERRVRERHVVHVGIERRLAGLADPGAAKDWDTCRVLPYLHSKAWFLLWSSS